jgi:hypothetical protein
MLYPVFEIDGEEYVADVTMCLTSNPPQYNAYRLKDKKHRYVYCSEANGSKVMYPHDFYEFMHGKATVQISNAVGDVSGSVAILTTSAIPAFDPTVTVEPVTYPRPKTNEEKISEIQALLSETRLELKEIKSQLLTEKAEVGRLMALCKRRSKS